MFKVFFFLNSLPLTTVSVAGHTKLDVKLPGKGNSTLTWHEAGPPDAKVDPDQ